jgi:hypothetical protein
VTVCSSRAHRYLRGARRLGFGYSLLSIHAVGKDWIGRAGGLTSGKQLPLRISVELHSTRQGSRVSPKHQESPQRVVPRPEGRVPRMTFSGGIQPPHPLAPRVWLESTVKSPKPSRLGMIGSRFYFIVIIEALLHVIPVVTDKPVNISIPNHRHVYRYSNQDSNKTARTHVACPLPPQTTVNREKRNITSSPPPTKPGEQNHK